MLAALLLEPAKARRAQPQGQRTAGTSSNWEIIKFIADIKAHIGSAYKMKKPVAIARDRPGYRLGPC